MSAFARIHVLKRQAALDEASYRDLMERETGKRSAKDLNASERQTFIRALNRLQPAAKRAAQTNGPYAKKLQALWIAGYNLGVIDNRSDRALRVFLKRQTGLDHSRFLRNPQDADKAIEALKDWIRRKTGNPGLFRIEAGLPEVYNDPRFQVVLHLWSDLVARGAAPASTLTGYLSQGFGKDDPTALTSSDWIALQNTLGQLRRSVKR
ncbi:regulatory protein GemA [Labrenzia sp. R4_2]|uniref:regulatory protein GemA n=1 Tax=Labrenzia sp. R4_2 TaxID=2821107 RepID=UPI001ADCC094|nr:regulatory protein GemA [Labrenzia sp. R4_2]MBO9419173.1 regulatory protein GemA [Labrenzia sp. R4_2]